MANIREDVIEIVAKQAKVDGATLTLDTHLSELNLQSIDIVELVFAIEEKFDIEVPYSPSDMNTAGISFDTVGDIIDAVERMTAEQHAKKAV
ncbi:MAG TPA: phosphopantetheine-binding protein [Rhizomicrobium sp.]